MCSSSTAPSLSRIQGDASISSGQCGGYLHGYVFLFACKLCEGYARKILVKHCWTGYQDWTTIIHYLNTAASDRTLSE